MFEMSPENFFIGLAVADSDYYPIINYLNKTYYKVEFHRFSKNENLSESDSNSPDYMVEDIISSEICSQFNTPREISEV